MWSCQLQLRRSDSLAKFRVSILCHSSAVEAQLIESSEHFCITGSNITTEEEQTWVDPVRPWGPWSTVTSLTLVSPPGRWTRRPLGPPSTGSQASGVHRGSCGDGAPQLLALRRPPWRHARGPRAAGVRSALSLVTVRALPSWTAVAHVLLGDSRRPPRQSSAGVLAAFFPRADKSAQRGLRALLWPTWPHQLPSLLLSWGVPGMKSGSGPLRPQRCLPASTRSFPGSLYS